MSNFGFTQDRSAEVEMPAMVHLMLPSVPVFANSDSMKYLTAAWLCAAAAADDVSLLRRLVGEQGISVDEGDYDKRTAIHLAASEGCLSAVQCLVEELHAAVSPLDRWGRTPLDDATREGHEAVRRYLAKSGATSGVLQPWSNPGGNAEVTSLEVVASPVCEIEDGIRIPLHYLVQDHVHVAQSPSTTSHILQEATARLFLDTKVEKIARLRGSLSLPKSYAPPGIQSLSCTPTGSGYATPEYSGRLTPPAVRPTRNFRKKRSGHVQWAEELEHVKEFRVTPQENELDKLRRALGTAKPTSFADPETICAEERNAEITEERPVLSSSSVAEPQAPGGSTPIAHEGQLALAELLVESSSTGDPESEAAASLALMAAAHRAAAARTNPTRISALEKLRLSLSSPMLSNRTTPEVTPISSPRGLHRLTRSPSPVAR